MKSPVADIGCKHGVRQVAPVESRASAPGGVELIVRMAGFGCVNWSKLEENEEQLANARAHATIAIGRGILLSVFLTQSKFASGADALASVLPLSLNLATFYKWKTIAAVSRPPNVEFEPERLSLKAHPELNEKWVQGPHP